MSTFNGVIIFGWLIFSILGAGCSTQENTNIEGVVIDQSRWLREQQPWPNHHSVWKKGIEDQDLKSAHKVCDIYDFDGDGRADMVKKTSVYGNAHESAFDFDLDGEIDVIIESKQPSGR